MEGGITLSECVPDSGCCRVDIYHDGEMGTICDDGVEDAVATVICRQIGMKVEGASVLVGGSGSGDSGMVPGEGMPIWLDSLQCTGDEEHLYDCDHEPWGEHNCEHQEDMGVCCPGGKALEGED